MSEQERVQVFVENPLTGSLSQMSNFDQSQWELVSWWIEAACEDLALALPKAEQYGGAGEGSADLRLIGDSLAELLGARDLPDAVRQELGVWFYFQGKSARLVSDYQVGRPGNLDHWHDATVYSMMARRLQAVGRWP